MYQSKSKNNFSVVALMALPFSPCSSVSPSFCLLSLIFFVLLSLPLFQDLFPAQPLPHGIGSHRPKHVEDGHNAHVPAISKIVQANGDWSDKVLTFNFIVVQSVLPGSFFLVKLNKALCFTPTWAKTKLYWTCH